MGKNKGKKSNSSSGSHKKIEIEEPDFGASPTKTLGGKKLLKALERQKEEAKQTQLASKKDEKPKYESAKISRDVEKVQTKINNNKVDPFASCTQFHQSAIEKKKTVPKNEKTNIDYFTLLPTSSPESKRKGKSNDRSPTRSVEESSSSNWESSNDDHSRYDKSNKSKNYQSNKIHLDFTTFKSKLNKTKIDFGKIKGITGDLFDAPKEYSLAHCVAEDFSMGAGIAVQFRKEFRNVAELLSQNVKTGGVAILQNESRFIYYLVTKKFSYSKPLLETVWSSLMEMKFHMIENKVTKLAMPQIGCGLDGLDWDDVKQMIDFIYQDLDVDICVYKLDRSQTFNLQSSSRDQSNRKKGFKRHAPYPLTEIVSGTGHIFFGTENCFISPELRSLDEKFPGLIEFYRTETKNIGDIIIFTRYRHSDYVYGLIWKRTQNDDINYKILGKCLSQLKKTNDKQKDDKYEYFGFDAIMENHDGLLTLEKIINLFQSTFLDAQVYICWPEKIRHFMPNFGIGLQ